MRRLILGGALALLASVASAAPAGQAGAKSVRMWNPDAIATVSGEIETVERIEMGDGLRCVRLRLRTADGVLQVRVGPADWVASQRRALAAGERVEVKGSRVTFAGEPALVAAEIVRGADRWVLRDAAGHPAWAAR